MFDITKTAEWLKKKTEWQETPTPLSIQDYEDMIVEAIKRLFLDTGRAEIYNEDLYVVIEDSEHIGYDYTIPLDEAMYIQDCAMINFFEKVQTDVNNTFGYSTDALTVTHADKPYENLKDTITKYDNQRRIDYYKMVRYTLG